MKKWRPDFRLLLLAIPLVSLAFHWYVLDLDLVGIHVWRQCKTQQVVNNFYLGDLNILHPRCNSMDYPDRLIFQEFPLMQWLFALVYRVFGNHLIISRLLSFSIGMCSVLGMFRLAAYVLRDNLFAAVTAWAFCFSPVFHYYTVNPMPDNLALCLALWALVSFMSYTRTRKPAVAIGSALLFGMAALVKLPYILFLAFPVTWLFYQFRAARITLRDTLWVVFVLALALLPALLWYGKVVPTWGHLEVLSGVLGSGKSVPELAYILQGTIVSVLPELLINYAALPVFLTGLWTLLRGGNIKYHLLSPFGILVLALSGYYLYEMAAIDTVHDYYLFPFLPILFIVFGLGLKRIFNNNVLKLVKFFVAVCILMLPATAFVRCYSRWDVSTDTGFERVFYDHKELIRNATPQNALCVIGVDQSDMVLLYYADRVGWTYGNAGLSEAKLSDCIQKGARYLYATDNAPDDPAIKSHLEELILRQGNLRIYRLGQH